MPKQFKTARLINKLKVTEAAQKLGVSQPTLSAWEGERKSPSIDSLENMADLYGVTTDFLLGRNNTEVQKSSAPIPVQSLPVFHEKPVWSRTYGWMLVNAIERRLLLPNGESIPFPDEIDLFTIPPSFSEAYTPNNRPLSRAEALCQSTLWLEPISPDSSLRNELRGWYQVKNIMVENECGNRFSFDTYGSKWLAFSSKLDLL